MTTGTSPPSAGPQGEGLETELLAPFPSRAGQDKVSWYLETSDRCIVDCYERLGFRTVAADLPYCPAAPSTSPCNEKRS